MDESPFFFGAPNPIEHFSRARYNVALMSWPNFARSPNPNNPPAKPKGGSDLLALVLFLLLAVALRLTYPLDFEYKYDQIYLFQKSQTVGHTEHWPTLGMSSGVGTKNPPLSIWIFPALAKLTHATTPEALTQAQIALNLLALAALAALILVAIPAHKREPWIWAFGIACVNWHQVFYDRVLWSQSALPLFCVAHLAAFLHRRSRAGSLALGLTGPLLGQIHMPGFYFVAGIKAALLLLDRRSVHWRYWALGVALAAIPLLPWLIYLMTESVPRGGVQPSALLDGAFWVNAFHQATGTDFSFRFGKTLEEFLLGPWIQGRATRFVMTLQAICALIGITAIVSAAGKAAARWQFAVESGKRRLQAALVPESFRDEALLLTGGVAGFGLLLTLSGFRIYPHYLLTAFPLVPLSLTLALWKIEKVRRSRMILAALVFAQLLTTALLREHLHETGGSSQSDHGVIFSRQARGSG
jgi:hypothetical protein